MRPPSWPLGLLALAVAAGALQVEPPPPGHSPPSPRWHKRNRKLVEWDDDEQGSAAAAASASASASRENMLSAPSTHKPSAAQQPRRKQPWLEPGSGLPANSSSHNNVAANTRKLAKLVYHGRLASNETVRWAHGLRLQVRAHTPVRISRSEAGPGPQLLTGDSPAEPATSGRPEPRLGLESAPQQLLLAAASDWRPIVVVGGPRELRNRRASEPRVSSAAAQATSGLNQWTPVGAAAKTRRQKEPSSAPPLSAQHAPQTRLAEPFETADGEPSELATEPAAGAAANQARSPAGPKWTPLETTTTTTTTTSATTPANLTGEQAAQRSASDLNYIYSSSALAPPPPAQVPAPAPSSYYSNYVMQPSPGAELVDSVSGQQPEMVAERAPELPAAQEIYSYGPAVSSLARGYYGGRPGSESVAAGRSSMAAPAAAPATRQEHHYHYYGPMSSPAPERQAPPVTTNLVREIQPLIISQAPAPAPVQQQPQIIREIIKEVPVLQTGLMQPQRTIVLPQPVPVPVPMAVRGELEPSLSLALASGGVAAQRVIRHLSSGLPTVSIRANSLPPLRIQVPSLQLPLRLAGAAGPSSAVTRQTASFVIPPVPQKTTTYLTETQAMPTHTTIMQTTQFTPATRTTVYTTEHQPPPQSLAVAAPPASRQSPADSYKSR